MEEFVKMKCEPCRVGAPPATEEEIQEFMTQLPDWNVKDVDGINQLERLFKFKNFVQALEFTNKVGEIAEAKGHHPVLKTEWGGVTVTWWTHKIKGLHRNDFIMAARTDKLLAT